MYGDIKGAFLSDTDTTNLVQGDILGGKGTFDDASYWTAGSSWTVSGGVATATSTSVLVACLTDKKMEYLLLEQGMLW